MHDHFYDMSPATSSPNGLDIPDKSFTGKPKTVDDTFQAGVDRLLNKYRSRLTKEEDQNFENTTLTDVKVEILQVQEHLGKEKKNMCFPRIERFLDAMSQWGKVVSMFAEDAIFLAFVWGPVKYLIKVNSRTQDLLAFIHISRD